MFQRSLTCKGRRWNNFCIRIFWFWCRSQGEIVCLVTHSCMTLCKPWTVACQAICPWRFSRPEYWSRLPCPSPGDLPGPGIKPSSFTSPALVGEFFTTSATWYIIITPNPSFIVGFTLDVIHSGGLDNYIMTFIQHYCIIQSSFTAIKILCAPPFTHLPSTTRPIVSKPGNPP